MVRHTHTHYLKDSLLLFHFHFFLRPPPILSLTFNVSISFFGSIYLFLHVTFFTSLSKSLALSFSPFLSSPLVLVLVLAPTLDLDFVLSHLTLSLICTPSRPLLISHSLAISHSLYIFLSDWLSLFLPLSLLRSLPLSFIPIPVLSGSLSLSVFLLFTISIALFCFRAISLSFHLSRPLVFSRSAYVYFSYLLSSLNLSRSLPGSLPGSPLLYLPIYIYPLVSTSLLQSVYLCYSLSAPVCI